MKIKPSMPLLHIQTCSFALIPDRLKSAIRFSACDIPSDPLTSMNLQPE